MIVAIHQPNFLPWPGFFHKMLLADRFVFLDNVQYVKNALFNRNKIKTPHGVQYLTVPVHLSGHRQPYNRVRIAPGGKHRWIKKHLKTIAFAYQKAPFYAQYFPALASIYGQSWERLVDLNLALIRFVAHCLDIQTPTTLASEIDVCGLSSPRLIALCRHFNAAAYLSGDGSPYLDQALFNDAGVQVRFQEFVYPVYPQINGAFVSHLSMLDLLFNSGPAGKTIILKHQRQTDAISSRSPQTTRRSPRQVL